MVSSIKPGQAWECADCGATCLHPRSVHECEQGNIRRERDELRAENERLGIDMRAWKILAESAEVDIERLRAALADLESIHRSGPPVDMTDAQAMWRRFCAALDRAKCR